jgi:MFS transporter, DHA2 family, multidrug resistance protein
MSTRATTLGGQFAEWHPASNPWLIATAVMTATFMEVLDTSVANVALQHIAGSLSVSSDEATWVLTSYLVSNAVVLPATGWLSRYFGRRRFLIGCIALFTFASALCGMADSLGMLIVARILQGVGGGALQPVSQAVMLETFPQEKRGISMSVYSIGVIVAPILGPTLGGWLTDDYSWRWVFYINLPVGIFAIIMCLLFLENPPYLKSAKGDRIDFIGLGLLVVWIGCLQIMLDKGQDEDWFSSLFIQWLAVGTSAGLVAFVIWEFKVQHPIVDLRILADRNLAIATVLMFVVGAILYSTTAVLPRFLQTLLNYPALQSGLVLSPRGIGSIIGAILAGQFLSRTKIDARYWMAQGAVVLAISMMMFGNLNLDIAPGNIIWPVIISGFGIPSIFVPMTTFSVATVGKAEMADATGITSLVRNLGGAVGISLITTFVTRGTQAHQALRVSHLVPHNHIYLDRLSQMETIVGPHSGAVTAQSQAHGLLYETLQQQAALWSYIGQFRLLAVVSLLLAPIIFLYRKSRSIAK